MRSLMLIAAFALTGCATASPQDEVAAMLAPVGEAEAQAVQATAAASPLGTKENPVRATMPPGQRAYLDRLRCSDGTAPSYHRGGSVGRGPYGKIMDVYELRCSTGEPATASVYMDMYHNHVEDRPVPGFTIAPR